MACSCDDETGVIVVEPTALVSAYDVETEGEVRYPVTPGVETVNMETIVVRFRIDAPTPGVELRVGYELSDAPNAFGGTGSFAYLDGPSTQDGWQSTVGWYEYAIDTSTIFAGKKYVRFLVAIRGAYAASMREAAYASLEITPLPFQA